ncbi:hypothetical protein ACFL3S_11695, partial [Gemmatimonadota bacterium]
MVSLAHRRQVLLFLGAILLPCAALLASFSEGRLILPWERGEAREVLELPEPCRVTDVSWSSDGRHILFLQRDEGGTAI